MGRRHGEVLAERIRAFVPMRFDATLEHLRAFGIDTVAPLVDLARRCRHVHARWDPDGHAEHAGIAEGAGVDADELYAAANMTDLRDVLAYGGHNAFDGALRGLPADAEGCSAVLVPKVASADGEVLAAQTWDLNPQDLDFVVAIHRLPDAAPESWSVTCTGCLSLVGMNAAGLAVGTTNVKTRDVRPGVGYMGVLHRMLECRTFAEAAAACEQAPRAAAHTYWLADAERIAEWETSASKVLRRDADRGPLARTNHCLHTAHVAEQAEPPTSSSRARLARIQGRLGALTAVTPDDVRAIFADRSDGFDSVNRFPEDQQGTATNAVVVMVPVRREMWACRGPADRGAWVRLAFAA
jgi:isopenicillin-N N-acyltransferase-like protein